MSRQRAGRVAAVAAWIFASVGLTACEEERAERSEPESVQPGEPTEPNQPGEPADQLTYQEILQNMSERLAASDALTVRARRHLDAALVPGPEVAEDAEVEVEVRRPDHLHGVAETGTKRRQLYFDGQRFTVFSETDDMYATEPIEGSIDDLVARVADRFGFTPPLSEFVANDPIAHIQDQVRTGRVGGVEEIEGRQCRQLQLRGDASEAELWVGVEDKLPCRLSVTFTEIEGRPEMRVDFHEWNLDADIPDDRFTFEAPPDAIEIEMVPIEEIQGRLARADTE